MKKLYNIAYNSQKCSAKQRNIEWHFTYDTWVNWWGEDITKRGRKTGQLVMSRYNDTGPYHPDNVCKLPQEKNAAEGHIGKTGYIHTCETKTKISASKKAYHDSLVN